MNLHGFQRWLCGLLLAGTASAPWAAPSINQLVASSASLQPVSTVERTAGSGFKWLDLSFQIDPRALPVDQGQVVIYLQGVPAGAVVANATGVMVEGQPFVAPGWSATQVGGAGSGSPTIEPPTRSFTVLMTLWLPQSQVPTLTARAAVAPRPILSEKEALMGPDANGNGVRDDLEAPLQTRYGANPAVWRAARQYVAAYGRFLGAADSQQAIQAANAFGRSFVCAADTFESAALSTDQERLWLKGAIKNTKARVVADIKVFNLLAGQTSAALPRTGACDAQ